jgi:cation:H+ antiporter
MSDSKVSRADGAILLLGMVFYFAQLISQEERFSKVFSNHFIADWVHFKSFLKDLFLFSLGVALLLISSEGIVFSTLKLAKTFNVSLIIIGALAVAVGTSLPELSFGIRSITMGYEDMLLGDVMGSVVVNSAFVLGISALISPLQIFSFPLYLKGFAFTVATSIFFVIFATTDNKITRKEALFLIAIYFSFVITEIFS